MNTGRFFKLDEDSIAEEGVMLFTYMPFSLRSTSIDPAYSPIHPIYLTISKYNISFGFHATYIQNKKENTFIHRNTNLIHLPLSSNLEVKDNLTSILIDSYNTEFPSFDTSEGNSEEVNQNIVHESVLEFLKNRINNTKEHSVSSYSMLSKFGIYNPIELKKEDKKGITVFLRILILDFLFDLEHSEVFRNSPHYENAEMKLKENIYFQLIAYKAAYYYRRGLLQAEINKQPLDTKYLKFIFAEFQNSEIQWVSALIRYEKIINSSIGFVKHAQNRKKLKDYFVVPQNQDNKDNGKQPKAENAGWFKLVHKELQEIVFDKANQFNRKLFIHKTNDTFHAKKLDSAKGSTSISLHKEVREASSHEVLLSKIGEYAISRFNLKLIFKIIWGRRAWGIILGLISLIFGLIIAYAANRVPVIVGYEKGYWPFTIVLLPSFTLFFIFISSIIAIKKLGVSFKGIFMPRLTMSITSGVFLLSQADEIWRLHFDIHPVYALFISFLLLIVIIYFVFTFINKADKYLSAWSAFSRAIQYTFIGLSFSLLITAVVNSYIAPGMLERSGFISEFFSDKSVLSRLKENDSIAANEIIRWQSDKTLPTNNYMLYDSSHLFKLLEKVEDQPMRLLPNFRPFILYQYNIPFIELKLNIIPGMYLLHSILALFIGIFFSLAFQDKGLYELME